MKVRPTSLPPPKVSGIILASVDPILCNSVTIYILFFFKHTFPLLLTAPVPLTWKGNNIHGLPQLRVLLRSLLTSLGPQMQTWDVLSSSAALSLFGIWMPFFFPHLNRETTYHHALLTPSVTHKGWKGSLEAKYSDAALKLAPWQEDFFLKHF